MLCKTRLCKMLVIAVSAWTIASGAFAQTPVAQGASPNPSYLLVVGKTTDRVKIGAYAAALPPIYAANNAYYLAIGGAGRGVTWLEGPWRDRSIILGKFPSRSQDRKSVV